MYADDDLKGRYSGQPNYAKDDFNFLYPAYISQVKTFVCPNTRNGIDPLRKDSSGRLIDLQENATSKMATNGPSYELYGYYNFDNSPQTPKRIQKTQTTVSTRVNESTKPVGTAKVSLAGQKPGPSRTWIIQDSDDPNSLGGKQNKPDATDNHGADGANTAFCDGHAEFITGKRYAYEFQLSQDAGSRSGNP
jgi:prepilin-type processing-associated H-X9-DG protein